MKTDGLNNDFLNLKRDYDCCQRPLWYDPMTVRTLDNIVCAIKQGRISLNDFRQFVSEYLGEGDFAWGCLQYVKSNLG